MVDEEKPVPFQVRMPPATKETLETIRKNFGYSMNAMVLVAINSFIEGHHIALEGRTTLARIEPHPDDRNTSHLTIVGLSSDFTDYLEEQVDFDELNDIVKHYLEGYDFEQHKLEGTSNVEKHKD